jgi:hypothetical protein
MADFAVHNEPPGGGPRGFRRLILPFRRLLVRILRPIFGRLASLLEKMDEQQRRIDLRQEGLARQVDALLNHGWDQAALMRRIATLEQQVEELLQRIASTEAAPSRSYFAEEDNSALVADHTNAPR